MSYQDRLDRCIKVLNDQISERNLYSRQKEEAEKKAEGALNSLKDLDACISIIQSIASGLQNNIKDKIIAVVQKALDETFPGMYFGMEFVTRRDKTECDMFITDNDGNKQSILDGFGGGLKDIVSFALRVAVWSLDRGASPVILLDEPMKFLSKGMRAQGASLLTVLSRDLGIQFIVVSHVEEVIEAGTKVYTIKKDKNGVSAAY